LRTYLIGVCLLTTFGANPDCVSQGYTIRTP
jgi:hypothetical protein